MGISRLAARAKQKHPRRMVKRSSPEPVWYISRGGEQRGPLSNSVLLRLAELGRLRSDDLVWHPGFENWTTAGSIPGLTKGGPEIPPTRILESHHGSNFLRHESGPPDLPLNLSEISPIMGSETDEPSDVADAPKSIFRNWADQSSRSAALPRKFDKDYFIRHWRGELSLPVSFWLNAWLLQILFSLATRVLAKFMPPPVTLGLLILFVAITVWGWVGVWRSALRSMKQEKRHFWPIIACSVVVLVALSWVLVFVT